MRLSEILAEGRDAPLYHGTGFYNAIEIVKRDQIEARTNHCFQKSCVSGVSLTRSRTKAFAFGPVVFELDQRKLNHNHRIMPVEYWWHPQRSPEKPTMRSLGPNVANGNEAEEFCVGPIKPIRRFLTVILMTEKGVETLKGQLWPSETVALLLDHPLLRIAPTST